MEAQTAILLASAAALFFALAIGWKRSFDAACNRETDSERRRRSVAWLVMHGIPYEAACAMDSVTLEAFAVIFSSLETDRHKAEQEAKDRAALRNAFSRDDGGNGLKPGEVRGLDGIVRRVAPLPVKTPKQTDRKPAPKTGRTPKR